MPLTITTPTAVFCAARIPLPPLPALLLPALQKAVKTLLSASSAPTDFTLIAPLSTLPVTLSPIAPLSTLPVTLSPTTTHTTLTVHRLLTSQNGKLILLATLPTAPTTLLVAKLRTAAAAADLAGHAHELAMLALLTGHPLFPALVAHGTAGAQKAPLLLMQYLPHPSLAALLRDAESALWRRGGGGGEWGVGDKRALQRDGVLWGGVVAVVAALAGRGLRQGDLRGANVLYDVVGGGVWGVDLEGVVRVEEGRGEVVDVVGVVEEFWRFELCAPGGRVW